MTIEEYLTLQRTFRDYCINQDDPVVLLSAQAVAATIRTYDEMRRASEPTPAPVEATLDAVDVAVQRMAQWIDSFRRTHPLIGVQQDADTVAVLRGWLALPSGERQRIYDKGKGSINAN